MGRCPNCDSENWHYDDGWQQGEPIEPGEGWCDDCGFCYAEHCKNPLHKQIEKFRKRKGETMTILEVFEKYKHLDKVFMGLLYRETTADTPPTFQDQMLYDLWQAVKSEAEKPAENETECGLGHVPSPTGDGGLAPPGRSQHQEQAETLEKKPDCKDFLAPYLWGAYERGELPADFIEKEKRRFDQLGQAEPLAGGFPTENRCDRCGTTLIDKCIHCGAPQRCPLCCAHARLDAQKQEIEKLKESYDQLHIDFDYLVTENKELRDATLWADEERHKSEAENKAQAERIEKLESENKELRAAALWADEKRHKAETEIAELRVEAPIPSAWWKDCPELAQRTMERIMEKNEQLISEKHAQTERIEKLEVALQRIQTWAKAYPLDVFPKSDFKKAREVLEAADMSLDAVSADNMRHVLEGLQDICKQALVPVSKPDGQERERNNGNQ